MSHLSLETIARLVDEAPDANEAAHLATCAQCNEELEAMRGQTTALSGLGDIKPRRSFDALERQLQREGLIPAERRFFSPTILRIAAGVLVYILGAASGAYIKSARSQGANEIASAQAPGTATNPQTVSRPVVAVNTPASNMNEPRPEQSSTRATGQSPDAESEVRSAEAAYLRALARLTEARPAANGPDPVTRLATLESILLTTKAALQQAPADPIINGYHLTALAQRDAMLRQIEAQTARANTQTSSNPWF